LGHHEYDWTEQVRALEMPVLIALGDGDSLSPAHAAEMFALLGGGQRDGGLESDGLSRSRLAVLPRTTYYDGLASPVVGGVLVGFLAGEASNESRWRLWGDRGGAAPRSRLRRERTIRSGVGEATSEKYGRPTARHRHRDLQQQGCVGLAG